MAFFKNPVSLSSAFVYYRRELTSLQYRQIWAKFALKQDGTFAPSLTAAIRKARGAMTDCESSLHHVIAQLGKLG